MTLKQLREAFFQCMLDESGQAIVEYLLLFVAVISVVGLIKSSIKKITVRIWTVLAKKVAAPCASCDAGVDFDL